MKEPLPTDRMKVRTEHTEHAESEGCGFERLIFASVYSVCSVGKAIVV
jgi:hypothetical protein